MAGHDPNADAPQWARDAIEARFQRIRRQGPSGGGDWELLCDRAFGVPWWVELMPEPGRAEVTADKWPAPGARAR